MVVGVQISSKEEKEQIILTVVKVLTKFLITVRNKGILEEAIAKISNQESDEDITNTASPFRDNVERYIVK
jgi:hypothetical protein